MESVWSVSKLSTESVGSRRELVANCVHTADADATKQFRRRRRCVLGFTCTGRAIVSILRISGCTIFLYSLASACWTTAMSAGRTSTTMSGMSSCSRNIAITDLYSSFYRYRPCHHSNDYKLVERRSCRLRPMTSLIFYLLDSGVYINFVIFTRDSIYATARICYRNSVCPSVTRVNRSKTVEARIMEFSPYSIAPSF